MDFNFPRCFIKVLVRARSTECFASEDFVLVGYEATALEFLKMKRYAGSNCRDSNTL
jgi:hypothetical protein